jgi:predicted phage terminase large subunit-like protein
MTIDFKDELSEELKGSFLKFTRFFYKVLTSRDFIVSEPVGRESHHITIARALTRAARLELPTHRLLINTPPGSGKSTLLTMFVAWTMAQYPDSKYIYVSYSKTLADKMTEQIKKIMSLKEFEYLFDVRLRRDSKAKDYFQTEQGGAVASAGSAGTITGLDAGLAGLERWGGCLLLDDLHKVDEAHSQTSRESVIRNYDETLQQRLRGKNTAIILISQRVHESDISQHLIDGKDGKEWTKIIIKSIDDAGNIMYPEVYSKEMLLAKKEMNPYVFSSQYQQEPIPAGGALFKPDWFVLLDDEPSFLFTFVVADTAETAQTYNDATAMSFFGVYEIENFGVKTGLYGIHWIDALETHVEPKDLKQTFLSFFECCSRHKSPPKFAAIEKKSTGTSLISALSDMRGIVIKDINRSKASGSKTKRFLDAQPFVAEKRISFTRYAKHVNLCITHMSKITANDSHARDDLADVLSDAISMALSSNALINQYANTTNYDHIGARLMQKQHHIERLRAQAFSSLVRK